MTGHLLQSLLLTQLSLINATYIMSANYPKYYLTGEDCSWRVRIMIIVMMMMMMMIMMMKVRIPPHQSLLVRVLDLHLRGNSGTGQ